MLDLAPTRSPFASIAARVARGERLSRAEGIHLAESLDCLAVTQLAAQAKHLAHGDRAYYTAPRLVAIGDASRNVLGELRPVARRMLCAPDIAALERIPAPQGGAWRIITGDDSGAPFTAYEAAVAALRERQPAACIEGFTARDIWYFQAAYHLELREMLARLRAAGLDALAGDEGGAPELTPEDWLDIHRAAHAAGLTSTATLLCSATTTWEARVDQLMRLRALQDETGGFDRVVILVDHARRDPATALAELRGVAICRLILDNIPHIVADVVELGAQAAQTALTCGADTLQRPLVARNDDAASVTADLQDRIRVLGGVPLPLRRAISLLGAGR